MIPGVNIISGKASIARHQWSSIVCTPAPFLLGGGLSLQPNFRKGAGLTGSQFLKTNIYGGIYIIIYKGEGGLGQFTDLKGAWQKRRWWCFWGGVDTPIHTMSWNIWRCFELLSGSFRGQSCLRIFLLYRVPRLA